MNDYKQRSEYTANTLIRPAPRDPAWMEPSRCKRPASRQPGLFAFLLWLFA